MGGIVLLVVGCGTSGGDPVAVTVKNASAQTLGSHTAHVDITKIIADTSQPGEPPVEPPQVTTGSGSVDFQTKASEVHSTSNDPSTPPSTVIVIGTDEYTQQRPGGPWNHRTIGFESRLDRELSVPDATGLLDAMRTASTSFRLVGHDKIDGATTSHFHAEVKEPIMSGVAPTFPFDAWVAGGRVLKIQYLASIFFLRETVTETFSDFGTAVRIVAPTDVVPSR